MNAERRKQLDKANGLIDEAKTILETVQEEEQTAYDNMPDSFRDGDRGEKAQASIDALTEAVDHCDNVIEQISTAKGE